MPLEKKKHPYQHTEPVTLYNRTHDTPDNVKEKIADFILELAQKFATDSGKIRILDAGIGEGSVITIPLIRRAIDKNISLHIVGFDNSLEMLNRFHENLEEVFNDSIFKESNGNASIFLKARFNEKVSLTIYKADIENKDSFNTFNRTFSTQKFHICLSFFLLHHLINWRSGLAELIDILDDGGYFIYAERLHDIAAMDGNQKRLYELIKEAEDNNDTTKLNFYKMLERLCKKRNKTLFWNPEISATNYIEVENAIDFFPQK